MERLGLLQTLTWHVVFSVGNFTKSSLFFLASLALCNYTRSHLTRDLINHVAPSQHSFGPEEFVQCERGLKKI